jgi:hypothetical protein
MMPPKFNHQFNQNSTSYGSENENVSYFSDFEEEGPTDLADYFSDEEEEESFDNKDLSNESDPCNQPNFDKFENYTDQEHSPSQLGTAIFGIQSVSETNFKNQGETRPFSGISSISEETKLAFSAWQPFIPPEHAFHNSAAQSWPLDFSLQAFSSQEPTLIQISTITTTKLTPTPTQPTSTRQETTLSQLKDWHSLRPATKNFMRSWTKPWPESTKTYSRTSNLAKEFQDRPEQSKQYKLWKQQSPGSTRTSQNQNTRLQNTPPVKDAGNANQVSTHFKSQIYLSTKPVKNTARTRSWGKKSRKFFTKTPTYRTKLQKNTRRHQKSSRRTQLWPWSRGRSPPICSLNTERTVKKKPEQKIYLHGENHFSKRRSEKEIYSQYKRINSNSDIKDENKDVPVKNEEKLMTLLINAKAKVTAKADKVKDMGKTLKEFRVEKQLDKKIESPVTLPPHFATTFNISILICIHITFTIFSFTFNIFILILNSFVSDPLDHHFQTFTIGDLSDCKVFCLARQTTPVQAKTTVKAFANPDSR